MRGADISGTEMMETDCTDVNFTNANLSEANFKHSLLKSVCFVNAKMGDVDFRGARFIECYFSGP